jgi:protoporphyrinogen oxidase
MRIAVIGGGIVGVSLAYFLSRAGHRVVLYEASDQPGGLAGTIRLGDVEVDRFYHTILSSDTHMQALAAELGIADRLRFRPTGSAFFHEGRLYPMTTLRDFMAFPLLRTADRIRLGLTILAAYLHRDWRRLEEISVEEWLVRWGGRRAFHHLWRPMLRAKFDGRFEDLPATYIWARLIRTRSTRRGVSQREMAGYLVGGHMTMIRAMIRAIEAAGGEIRLRTPVREVRVEENRVRGVRIDGVVEPFEAAAITLHPPLVPPLLPDVQGSWVEDLRAWRYLGVICVLLALDRPLTDYWTVYITDESVPFTGVIETTHYIDPGDVGGHHLVYLPKYVAWDSPWLQRSDSEILEAWLEHLQRMFPSFHPSWVRHARVHRERYVEPLFHRGQWRRIPPLVTPVEGLFLVNLTQIYPALTNGESLTRHAHRSAEEITRHLEGGSL